MSDRHDGAFVGGLLVGGALGAIAALMFAPRSGKDTRKILKKSLDALPELAEDLTDSLHLHADHLSENARRNWAGTLHRLQEAIAAGIEASKQNPTNPESPEDDIFTVPEIESPQN